MGCILQVSGCNFLRSGARGSVRAKKGVACFGLRVASSENREREAPSELSSGGFFGSHGGSRFHFREFRSAKLCPSEIWVAYCGFRVSNSFNWEREAPSEPKIGRLLRVASSFNWEREASSELSSGGFFGSHGGSRFHFREFGSARLCPSFPSSQGGYRHSRRSISPAKGQSSGWLTRPLRTGLF
jgi:hypothetical protein